MRSPGPAPITIVQEASNSHHFEGVAEALRARGAEAVWALVELTPYRVGPHTRVVAVNDVRAFAPLNALRQARRVGACTVLLMDGIVEYRNTFMNPAVSPDFLRPAPVDVIACAGPADSQRLQDLGNDAVATGLPRLARIEPTPLPDRPTVLVATARHPAFSDAERRCLVKSLLALRDRLESMGIPVRWRLTGGLDLELNVSPDLAPLTESLASATAVIATPSTLLVEAMRSGRTTALLHPFETPCWLTAAWVLNQETLTHPRDLDAAIRSLLHPGQDQLHAQDQALIEMHQQERPAAEALADLLGRIALAVRHP